MADEHIPRLVHEGKLWIASCWCGWQEIALKRQTAHAALGRHWLMEKDRSPFRSSVVTARTAMLPRSATTT